MSYADDLWNGEAMPNMFSNEPIGDEMYNPIDPFGLRAEAEKVEKAAGKSMKRKIWVEEATDNQLKFFKREKGETSGGIERMESSDASFQCKNVGNTDQSTHTTEQRGAVGPEPPLPP